MKAPKTLQFIVGCAVIYLAWHLADAGWFGRITRVFSGPRGFSGGFSDLVLDLLPYVVDTVCLFGSIAIAFYGFLAKSVRPFGKKLLVLIDKKLEEFGIDLVDFDESPESHKCNCELCPLKGKKDE
jgi:hypothetical protein